MGDENEKVRARFGNWKITDREIRCDMTGYFVEATRLLEVQTHWLPSKLPVYDWLPHLASKNWCHAGDLVGAFTLGLLLYDREKLGGVPDMEVLARSVDLVWRIAAGEGRPWQG